MDPVRPADQAFQDFLVPPYLPITLPALTAASLPADFGFDIPYYGVTPFHFGFAQDREPSLLATSSKKRGRYSPDGEDMIDLTLDDELLDSSETSLSETKSFSEKTQRFCAPLPKTLEELRDRRCVYFQDLFAQSRV